MNKLVTFFKRDEVLLLAAALIPRLFGLDVFLTADEPLFLDHARQFAAGLGSGDFSQTLGIGYPGVTLAWWTAPVVGLAQTEFGAYMAGRVATGLVIVLLLLLLYWLAHPLLGRWPALVGVGLLTLDPYTLAYSRLLHIEAPLAVLITLAGLAYLLWLDQPRRRWLFLSGLFTGLALLTKSTALLLGPMLVALLIGWMIQKVSGVRYQVSSVTPHVSRITYHVALKKIFGLLAIALLASVLFFALWPAMWVDPAGALNLTFSKLLTDQEAGAGNYGMFWLGHFVQDPGPLFYPTAFILKATPWLLFGLALSLWELIRPQKNAPRTTHHPPYLLPLWFFALAYLLLMTIASKKSIRYLLPAFPTFYLLAGLALTQFGQSVKHRIGIMSHVSRLTSHVSPLLLFLFTLFYHPYYFTYNNPLLLGWLWAPDTLLVGWGEGLDEAGRYLNERPPGVVAAWYEWLFPLYYQGQVQPINVDSLLTADHAVFYINQVQRNLPDPNIVAYFHRRQPEHTVRLAGIDYAWVYPGPIIGFRPDPAPHYPLGGEFGGEVRLLGYDLPSTPRSGQPLIVTLYWRVLATPPAERFVYLRLVDAQGRVWAKADSPPVMGFWPASRLQPDMLVEDAQALPIPPGTPPGTYRLEAGWYDPSNGQTLTASGQPLGGGGGLLLGEIQVGWQSLSVPPDLPHQTDTALASNAHLVGYETPPPTAVTGDVLPLTLAWREAGLLWDFTAVPNNFVMFEWRQNSQAVAGQLDPLPFPIEAWGRAALLRSQHEVIVPPTLAAGRYVLTVMLHTSSDPAGEAFSLGEVDVTSPPHQFDLPASVSVPTTPAQLEPGILLAGYEVETTSHALNLTLYWQTKIPLTTRYKIFAQMLTPDNMLLVQSDSLAVDGQRPTTGWLPGEIIADAHTLNFSTPPPPGQYRLIAGLYNPLTGQRLPLINQQGDAIAVTEITLP